MILARRSSRRAALAALVLLPCAAALAPSDGEVDLAPALAVIREEDARAHVAYLASDELEGRDSPSLGLELAARYVCERFAAAGLAAAGDSMEEWSEHASGATPPAWSKPAAGEGTYLRPFTVQEVERRPYRGPVAEECALELEVDGQRTEFVCGKDYVPVLGMEGDVRGELVFAGFGIDAEEEHYDDYDGLRLKGKVALILEGEPRHAKKFEGPDPTTAASLWRKVTRLAEEGVAGVLVARRTGGAGEQARVETGETREHDAIGFRYTWAFFPGQRQPDAPARESVPMLEVSMACASALLGEDVADIAAKMDRSVRPTKVKARERMVSLRAKLEEAPVRIDNVVAAVPGTDPALADEWVLVGAHYDHVGVGPRGVVGYGADDNASGTAALLEIAEAMSVARPRRSVLFAAFASEEDGLVGSKRLAADLPFATDALVAMVNLDMIGRGECSVAMILGVQYNPDLGRVVDRARKLEKTGVRKVEESSDRELFQRSDQYSFHEIGIPSVFFMEDLPIGTNTEYHTWKDTVEIVDYDKVASTARIAFNTAWILATDDERPSAPRE